MYTFTFVSFQFTEGVPVCRPWTNSNTTGYRGDSWIHFRRTILEYFTTIQWFFVNHKTWNYESTLLSSPESTQNERRGGTRGNDDPRWRLETTVRVSTPPSSQLPLHHVPDSGSGHPHPFLSPTGNLSHGLDPIPFVKKNGSKNGCEWYNI